MANTTQLNTRIDPELKRQGDAVFARAGLTTSEVVRGVWSYAAEHQEVPDFLEPEERNADQEAWFELVDRGAGLAFKLLRGLVAAPSIAADESSHEDLDSFRKRLEDEMYEGMVGEYEQLLEG